MMESVQHQASDERKSIHLSASAGSGKTRALKERYLALLEALDRRGLSADQAVAITFTDKAAAEIKERVLRDLPEAMLRKIIRGRQDLRISTIHSFCMNLLKRYPLEAGLPPDFSVLDSRDQAHRIRRAVEDALDAASRDAGLMAPLGGSTADELAAVVEFMLSIRSRLTRLEIDAGGPGELIKALRSGTGVAAAEEELSALLGSPAGKALFREMEHALRSQGEFYETCLGAGHALLAAAPDREAAHRAARALAPVYFTQKNEPRKKPAVPRAKFRKQAAFSFPEYEALFFRVQQALGGVLGNIRLIEAVDEAVSLLLIGHLADERYRDAKLREGLLDFDDLEIYAYRLLRSLDAPEILYWLDRRILHVLVDEFQDTSDIQWAVVNKLTEEIFSGAGAEKGMQPTLFVVGDEKQSIYRFREANYRIIDLVRSRMERHIPAEGRAVLTLDRNFRSAPEIIETVNGVFSALWSGSYQSSDWDRRDHRGGVRLIELTPPESGAPESGEAAVLAREINRLVRRGTPVYEKDAAGAWRPRPAQYGDCAVLIQSRSRLKDYEAALQAGGIPYRVVGGVGFYEEDEIQALLNILFFLWNNDDTLALAAALKSPLFGLTDADIFGLTRSGAPVREALDRRHPACAALFNAWMALAGLAPLAALLHRIVQDTGAYVRFGRRTLQALFNIDKLLDTAREFDRRGYTTLQDFVEWIRNIRATEQREATADVTLPGFEGAVSILTVHKAKGLEYPAVFLPGMNQQQKSILSGPPVIIESDGGVRMARKSDGRNPLYDELWEREREELRREHQRLLYVAMTRARDRLIMIASMEAGGGAPRQNTWLGYLHRAAPKPLFSAAVRTSPDAVLYAHPAEEEPAVSLVHTDEQSAAGQPGQIDLLRIAANLAPLQRSQAPDWKRATDFIEQEIPFPPVLPSSAEPAVSPLVRGSVLHRCLEEIAGTGTYDLVRIAAGFPDLERLEPPARERFFADARAVLESLLANAGLAWIFERGKNSYTELPFLFRRGPSLISGVIDRLVIENGAGRVIDYKAMLIESDAALAAWTDHYRPQVRIYCEAARELFGLASVEGSLLFLDSAKLVPLITL